MEREPDSSPKPLEPIIVDILSAMIGRSQIPVPMVILDDDSEIFDDPRFIEVERSIEENEMPHQTLIGKIIDLERVPGGNVFKASIAILNGQEDTPTDELAVDYELYISGQFLQVGLIASTFLSGGNAPSLFLVSEAEAQTFFIDYEDGEEHELDVDPTFVLGVGELSIHIQFPPISEDPDSFNRFSNLLSGATEELMESAAQRSDSEAPPFPYHVEKEFIHSVRANIVELISGLTQGKVESLLELYRYVDIINRVHKKILVDKVDHSEISEEERDALLLHDFISRAFQETEPAKLVLDMETSEDVSEDIVNFENMFTTREADLANSFDAILQEAGAMIPQKEISSASSDSEKQDYLTLASNVHPLRRNLALLADKLNIELLYSRDWNTFTGIHVASDEDSNEDEDSTITEPGLSRGELTVIYSIVIAQRLLLLADIVEDSEVGMTEEKVVISTLFDALTMPRESILWVLDEGLKRISGNKNNFLYREFVNLAETDNNDLGGFINSPFGALMHLLGHQIVQEDWSRTSMMLAFENQPEMKQFIQHLFVGLDELDDDEDEDENSCVVINALVGTLQEGVDHHKLIMQIGDSLAIIAELNAFKNVERNDDDDELKSYIKKYVEDFTKNF